MMTGFSVKNIKRTLLKLLLIGGIAVACTTAQPVPATAAANDVNAHLLIYTHFTFNGTQYDLPVESSVKVKITGSGGYSSTQSITQWLVSGTGVDLWITPSDSVKVGSTLTIAITGDGLAPNSTVSFGSGGDLGTITGNTYKINQDSCYANCFVDLTVSLKEMDLTSMQITAKNASGVPTSSVFLKQGEPETVITIESKPQPITFGTFFTYEVDRTAGAGLVWKNALKGSSGPTTCPTYTTPPDLAGTLTATYDLKLKYETLPEGQTTQPCAGTYVFTNFVTYRLKLSNGTVVGTIPQKTSAVSVTVTDQSKLPTLKVIYKDKTDPAKIINISTPPKLEGADPAPPANSPSPAPVDVTSTPNTAIRAGLYPANYLVTIDPPNSQYRSPTTPYKAKQNIFDNKEITAEFCPRSAPYDTQALCLAAPGETAATCTPERICEASSTLPTEQTPPTTSPPTTAPAPVTPSCLPDEIMKSLGTLGWVLRPYIEMLCPILEINAEIALPMLDVNIPLVSEMGDNAIVTKRTMFSKDILNTTAGTQSTSGLAQIFGMLVPTSDTPIEIYTLWEVSRNISLAGIVLSMVIMSFMIMFRVDTNKYTHMKLLTNIFIAVILISMSYQICTFILDMAKIMAYIAKDTLSAVNAGTGATTTGGLNLDLATSTALNIVVGLILPAQAIALGCFFAVLMGAYAVGLFALYSILVLRLLFIYVMVLLAPIIFILGVFPDLQKLRTNWFTSFITVCMMYPLAVMLYYLFLTISRIF